MSDPITVLIIDDNPFDRELVKESLLVDSSGFNLLEVASQKDLEKTLSQSDIDIILTDYNILNYTGLEVTDFIFSHYPDMPVIMLTGTGSEEIAVEAMKRGVCDYVIKTASHIKKLPLTIQKVLTYQKLRIEKEEAVYKELLAKKAWERTFNAITDPILILNPDLSIKQVNEAALRPEFSPEKTSKLHCYDFFDCAQKCTDCPLQSDRPTKKPATLEVTPSSTGKTYHVNIYPVLNAENEVAEIVLYAKDITKDIMLRKQLEQAQKMEAIGTLAGGIAHDFNNILSAIFGATNLAMQDVEKDSEIAEYLTMIQESGKRAAELVKQVLTFSRKNTVELQPLLPHLIVKEAMKMLHSTLPSTVSITEEIDAQCGEIIADPTHIHQIIVNLVTNAFHSLENETGSLSVNMSRKELTQQDAQNPEEIPGPYVVLTVSDTGHGMDQSTIERIFEPFFTTKEVGKGTGMGLSIIYGLVKDYNGFIRVESEPGKGSTFQVYFPALQQPQVEQEKQEDAGPIPTGTERIMLIDDEEALVSMYNRLLERLGYTVTTFSNGRTALEAFQSAPEDVDLILSDQAMPGLAGADMAREILATKPNFPIVLLTGFSSAVSEEEALNMGIKKYMRKPVDMAELGRVVRQLLDEK